MVWVDSFVLWVYAALCLPGLFCGWSLGLVGCLGWVMVDCWLPLVGRGLRWLACCCSLVFYAAAFLLRLLAFCGCVLLALAVSGYLWLFCRFWWFCVGVLVCCGLCGGRLCGLRFCYLATLRFWGGYNIGLLVGLVALCVPGNGLVVLWSWLWLCDWCGFGGCADCLFGLFVILLRGVGLADFGVCFWFYVVWRRVPGVLGWWFAASSVRFVVI